MATATKEKQTVSLNQISAEEKLQLLEELKREQESERLKIENERKAYKSLVNETIPVLFTDLVKVSALMSQVKKSVYENLQSLISMKADVFKREDDQATHSFTSENGITIIIGYRENDGWDDTVNTGISKVNDCLDKYVKDDNSKILIKTVRQLLSRDKKGNLKASRLLQLKRLADETNDPDFQDAIEIIQKAYRPSLSKKFVTCRYRNDQGEQIELPLSMSDAEFTN